jgi:hypothetical protein
MPAARLLIAAAILLSACTSLTPQGGLRPSAQVAAGADTDALDKYLRRKELGVGGAGDSGPYVAVLPLTDESGFRAGVWDLPREMARLVTQKSAAYPHWEPVPFDIVMSVVGDSGQLTDEVALACGARLGADLVVRGTIRDYNMERFSAGDPLLGGYKSYNGIAALELSALRVADGSLAARVDGRSELVDRDVGLDLLGRPREQDRQFTGLREIEFGSEAFAATVLGEATLVAVDQVLSKLSEALRPSALTLHGHAAEILMAAPGEVYISVGSENGVHAGYRFAVLPGAERVESQGLDPDTRLAVVEVIEVVGARLSSVRALVGETSLKAGDRLELLGDEDSP